MQAISDTWAYDFFHWESFDPKIFPPLQKKNARLEAARSIRVTGSFGLVASIEIPSARDVGKERRLVFIIPTYNPPLLKSNKGSIFPLTPEHPILNSYDAWQPGYFLLCYVLNLNNYSWNFKFRDILTNKNEEVAFQTFFFRNISCSE